MIFSAFSDLFVFKPVNIIDLTKKAGEANASKIPFLWTFSTSVFVETNVFFMLVHLFIINYIVIKNKAALEQSWRRRDLFMMIVISGFFATCTHFAMRVLIFFALKNESTYRDFSYSSMNFIIMAFLLGLR